MREAPPAVKGSVPISISMCSLVDDFTEELGKKPGIKCWGCGKKEEKGEKKQKFRQCPKCVELKIMPSLFCSDECFKKNWSRHRKEVHKSVKKERMEQQSDVKEQNVWKKVAEYTMKVRSTDTPYMRLFNEGTAFEMKNDYVNAKKRFRKAQKLNPKLPNVYGPLGNLYYTCGQREEGLKLMEAGIERWALTCLTGQYGDECLSDPDIGLDSYACYTHDLIEILIQPDGVPASYQKPAWFCNDFVLKRIIDVIREINTSKPYDYGDVPISREDVQHDSNRRLENLDCWQGHVLVGSLHNGILDLKGFHHPLQDRTAKDIMDAADCFRKDPQRVTKMPDMLMEIAKEWKSTPLNSARFYKGCFIIVFGLTSTIGKTQMNKKLGIVKTTQSADGRYGVQIDGLHESKSIHGKNLMLLPLPDRDVALVSCMAPAAQWKYLRPIGEGYAARLPDPK